MHDSVEGLGGLTVDAGDKRIDFFPGSRVAGIELFQGRQVFFMQQTMDPDSFFNAIRWNSNLLHGCRQGLQRGQNDSMFIIKQGRIFCVLGSIIAPEQHILPFLDLLFECDLRRARLIDGKGYAGEVADLNVFRRIHSGNALETVYSKNCKEQD
ncbi:hypothetical protein [Desulfovibrio sp. DV]|uniref:hypothetical protein n=1 Tax=Desulfovibrio sp. DV TaxID=1844708 RepID=UPI00158827BD|nr:hypothetical protein [Desulfovibrio sp. DV]